MKQLKLRVFVFYMYTEQFETEKEKSRWKWTLETKQKKKKSILTSAKDTVKLKMFLVSQVNDSLFYNKIYLISKYRKSE